MYEYRVKEVLKVVDGDTIDVVIDLGFDISFTSRVRLAGIDTPESRTTDTYEKKLGLEVKEFIKESIKASKDVVIKTEKMDSTEKYGRILGWIFLDGNTESLNTQMVIKGYAWDYDGGTKKKDFEILKEERLVIPQVLAPIDVYEICDRCGVKAKVAVEFISGELYFCGHHARMNAEFLYQKALKIYDPYQELDKL